MDRVFAASLRPFSEVKHVAVAIGQTGAGQYHIGLIHREAAAPDVLCLHLAWHCRLMNEPASSLVSHWIDMPTPSRRAQQVAARCRQIWKANGKSSIPYGFSHPSDSFDSVSGRFLLGPTRHGLTCASFVLAVFHFAGIPLADYATWPTGRSSDREWQESVVQLLQSRAAPEHIAAVTEEVGAVRFRPDDVAGAATQVPPVTFEVANSLGIRIVELIAGASAAPQY